jgi:hypothetical protein
LLPWGFEAVALAVPVVMLEMLVEVVGLAPLLLVVPLAPGVRAAIRYEATTPPRTTIATTPTATATRPMPWRLWPVFSFDPATIIVAARPTDTRRLVIISADCCPRPMI